MTVRGLQARMVKVVSRHIFDVAAPRFRKGALARLERHAGKRARAVLRGLGGSNPAWLPGGLRKTGRKVLRLVLTQLEM